MSKMKLAALLLVSFVAGDPVRLAIEGGFPVNKKQVVVMTVRDRNMNTPRPIDMLLHRVGCGIPIIEIPHEVY